MHTLFLAEYGGIVAIINDAGYCNTRKEEKGDKSNN